MDLGCECVSVCVEGTEKASECRIRLWPHGLTWSAGTGLNLFRPQASSLLVNTSHFSQGRSLGRVEPVLARSWHLALNCPDRVPLPASFLPVKGQEDGG